MGICRDVLDDAVVAALIDAGVNLCVVPACSRKVANLAAAAAHLAGTAPGLAMVANGPARFDGADRDVEVVTSVFSTAVEGGDAHHQVVLGTAGWVGFDLQTLQPRPHGS